MCFSKSTPRSNLLATRAIASLTSLQNKKPPSKEDGFLMVGLAGSPEFYEYSAISLILLRWLWDRDRQVT
jgi:hypothetical protein